MGIIDDRKNAVREEYGYFGTPQELFEYIVLKNKSATPLDRELKIDEFLVKGFVPTFADGKCHFKSDADSVITRGIASLVCSMYDGLTPEEVLQFDPSFLEELGITAHLTPNRRNGLSQLCKKIAEFAEFHKAQPR